MPRSFRNTAIAVLLLVLIAGLLYAYFLSIPAAVAGSLIAAFALETVLYVVPPIEAARKWIERLCSRPALAVWMTASAPLPYVVYAAPSGVFRWESLGMLALLGAAVSFWYVVLPRRAAVDVAFLAVVAAVLLWNPFEQLYPRPAPRLAVGILGQLMWTRLSILAALSIAGMEVKGFGLWPDRKEWRAGVLNFALFGAIGVALGWALGFARVRTDPQLWQLAPVALGMYLVVALREEFFFRGLLQEWLERWTGSAMAALVLASVGFGLVHLPFRDFPNWRFAVIAAVAGFFYGRAYLEARSVRAAMVTHALVNTAWRVFFT